MPRFIQITPQYPHNGLTIEAEQIYERMHVGAFYKRVDTELGGDRRYSYLPLAHLEIGEGEGGNLTIEVSVNGERHVFTVEVKNPADS